MRFCPVTLTKLAASNICISAEVTNILPAMYQHCCEVSLVFVKIAPSEVMLKLLYQCSTPWVCFKPTCLKNVNFLSLFLSIKFQWHYILLVTASKVKYKAPCNRISLRLQSLRTYGVLELFNNKNIGAALNWDTIWYIMKLLSYCAYTRVSFIWIEYRLGSDDIIVISIYICVFVCMEYSDKHSVGRLV